MAKATYDSTPIPRLRDLVRDPVVRESYRRRPLPRGGMSGIIRQLIESGDLIGRDVDGNFFILVTIPQRGFTWLCRFGDRFGERFADIEEDNVDQGEDEMPAPMHYGAGDPDDAEQDDAPEEDDHAGAPDDQGELNGDEGDYTPGRRSPAEEAFVAAARARLPKRDLDPRPVTFFHEDGSIQEVRMGHFVPSNLVPKVTA